MANEISLQYSKDQSTWTDLGPTADWDYGDGLATSGDTITSNLISTGAAKGLYHETGDLAESVGSSNLEFDITIAPVWGRVAYNTLYYFRLQSSGNTIEAPSSYPSLELIVPKTGPIWGANDFDDGTDKVNPSYSNSCWLTAGASWNNSCWLTAAGGWTRQANLALSGQN